MDLAALGLPQAKINQFNKKGIFTVRDLVEFIPYKYNDLSVITGVLQPDAVSCVIAVVDGIYTNYESQKPYIKAVCRISDTDMPLEVLWFNQTYLASQLRSLMGQEVLFAGKINWNEYSNRYSMASCIRYLPYNGPESMGYHPVYSSIKNMTPAYLTDKITQALRLDGVVGEVFPREIITQYSPLSRIEALRMLHQPKTQEDIDAARYRLMCDELLEFAAYNEWAHRNSAAGSLFSLKTLKLYSDILADLPYSLTDDQAASLEKIIALIREGKRTNALVQGDVGCGKTIVAMLMMAAFAGNGYQSVLMAPTQVLAKQHYNDAVNLFSKHGIEVAYLDTSIKARERKAIMAKIQSGEAKIVIGTHSLASKSKAFPFEFHNLALIVTDEEHKFGVAQREALVEKASAGVHTISMSATPIPRSLAQVIYGSSVQLYTIKTMPKGRKPVITGLASTQTKLFNFIIKQARQGLQTYVVCPMIEKNEDLAGVKSVEEVSKEYHDALDAYGVRIETLTGRDEKNRTEDVLARFKTGQIDVLISTTVIEVGVNVPTATTMVVVNAERFGLAGLHQLRGRVGRGSYQSFCVLDASNAGEDGLERLNVLVNNSNGFDIAKEDLRIRGAGDFIGTKQSGENKYLALVLAYPEEYQRAQRLAIEMIDKYGWEPPEEQIH